MKKAEHHSLAWGEGPKGALRGGGELWTHFSLSHMLFGDVAMYCYVLRILKNSWQPVQDLAEWKTSTVSWKDCKNVPILTDLL